MNGVEIGALLLMAATKWTRAFLNCANVLSLLPAGIYGEHQHLADFSEPAELNLEVPVDDHERIEKVQEYVVTTSTLTGSIL